MGYQIDYATNTRKPLHEGVNTKRVAGMSTAFLLLFVLLTIHFWPEGTDILRSLFIPGNPEVTVQAFEEMVVNLQSGEALRDVLTVFCKEIIANAQIPR